MAKHKTKYIFQCTAPEELTQFNYSWNKDIEDDCERREIFKPSLECLDYKGSGSPCKYLRMHKYKGDK